MNTGGQSFNVFTDSVVSFKIIAQAIDELTFDAMSVQFE
jgi:hypothetical protein